MAEAEAQAAQAQAGGAPPAGDPTVAPQVPAGPGARKAAAVLLGLGSDWR